MIFTCRVCKKQENIPITADQYRRWQDGGYIQNVCPELTPNQRELMLSRICGTCFDKMFKED